MREIFRAEGLAARATQGGRLGAQSLERDVGAAVQAMAVLLVAEVLQRARDGGALGIVGRESPREQDLAAALELPLQLTLLIAVEGHAHGAARSRPRV